MSLPNIQSKVITDVIAAGSVSTSAFGWLADVNEILQFVSLGISIMLGAYALYRLTKKDVK